mgnify:CR=1 FL=1
MKVTPLPVIYDILDALGEEYELRVMYYLLQAFDLDTSYCYKLLYKALRRSRLATLNGKTYYQKVIELWEQTGIDDGVPIDYLIHNHHKKLFRTIWSHETFYDNNTQNYVYYTGSLNDTRFHIDLKLEYTFKICKDNRINTIKNHWLPRNSLFTTYMINKRDYLLQLEYIPDNNTEHEYVLLKLY